MAIDGPRRPAHGTPGGVEDTLGFVARGLALLALLTLVGCAGHSDRTLEARSALDAGRPKAALQLYNEQLEVKSEKEIPEDVGGDNTLLLLDRSMILQQLEKYELASRDLELADKEIELLDFSRNALDSIGKYMFSDDTGPYKAPPYEKLMINTMNMVNYLARGDLNGARIEARRLAVMQKYLKESENPAQAMMGPGSYLAGFTFEKSGKPDQALRYYDEALAFGNYQSLRDAVTRLSSLSGYSTPRLRKLISGEDPTQAALDADQSVAIEPVLAASLAATLAKTNDFELSFQAELPAGTEAAATGGGASPPVADDSGASASPPVADDSGEIFAIVNFGRVPAKFAKRIPIGLALTYASAWMSPTDHARANELALQGLVTWVNYPELGKPRGTYDTPGFGLDGDWQQLEGALAVDREVRSAYDHARGAIIAAAITRMISRVVAGNVAGKAAGDDALGLLLNLGTQATLTAVDTPDTRSWATLPARMAFGRVRVPPGKHRVLLQARGHKLSESVDVPANGFKVVAMTVLE